MEANTVILNLDNYNNLRDFKTEIEKDHTLKFYTATMYGQVWMFISNDEALKEAEAFNKSAVAETEKLRVRTYELEREMNHKVDFQLQWIKKMSIWQFRKWRKSQTFDNK